MKDKLNLTIEKDVKARAKQLAKKKGISLSGMVEQILKSLTESHEDWKPREGSIVSEMSGSIPAPEGVDYDELLTDALLEKKGYEKNSD